MIYLTSIVPGKWHWSKQLKFLFCKNYILIISMWHNSSHYILWGQWLKGFFNHQKAESLLLLIRHLYVNEQKHLIQMDTVPWTLSLAEREYLRANWKQAWFPGCTCTTRLMAWRKQHEKDSKQGAFGPQMTCSGTVSPTLILCQMTFTSF